MFDFLSRKMSSLFSWFTGGRSLGKDDIDKILTQLEETLLEADVPYEVVTSFLASLKTKVAAADLAKHKNAGNALAKLFHQELLALLSGPAGTNEVPVFAIPSTILFMGLQGAGKTTTIGKVGLYLKKQAEKRGKQRRILCASVDYYRPAAREQLKVVAAAVGIDYYHAGAAEPLAATREITEYARKQGYEHLLLDTAGRLHVDTAMIDELQNVVRTAAPKYKILVLDSMTGQESLAVARSFNKAVGFDGALLTKVDSDARGGAALAFRAVLSKPIWFVGIGEKMHELETFIPERMASRLIGMGDVATLLEKTDDVVDKREQEHVAQRMMSGAFSLQDFLEQIDLVGKVGPLQTLARYLPGVAQLSPQAVEKGQQEMRRFRAIISSMTAKERLIPEILNGSRRKRIARGAGVGVQDVNQMLEKFEQTKQFVRMIKKSGAWRR